MLRPTQWIERLLDSAGDTGCRAQNFKLEAVVGHEGYILRRSLLGHDEILDVGDEKCPLQCSGAVTE